MKKIIFLGLVLTTMLTGSCNKAPYYSGTPFSFNLFLFSRNGSDLINPSSPNLVEASQITIEAELDGKPIQWQIGQRDRYLDGPSANTVDLSGFYCYQVYTPDYCEAADAFKNTHLDCTIHIDGWPDSFVTLRFNKDARVDRIEVNGKWVQEEIPYPLYYNVKLMY